MLTREMFARQWSDGDAAMIDGILATQNDVFGRFAITTPLRVAHFMGQVSVECVYGTRFVENLRYTSAERLLKIFPRYFKTRKAAEPYVRNPEGLANLVYGGRYGNRLGTDDGFRYSGKGLIQLTFRANYATIGKIAGLDLVSAPDLAIDPKHALMVAGAYWHHAKCNDVADVDVVPAVTKRVNGGSHGLHDRIQSTDGWKAALGI